MRSRLGSPSGELWPVGRGCVGYIGSTASSVFATLSTFKQQAMKAIPVICPTALVFLFSGVIGCFAQSPAPPVTLANTEQRTLTSAKIGQRYDLLVSLPGGYATWASPIPCSTFSMAGIFR